jgi:hypothetical protein
MREVRDVARILRSTRSLVFAFGFIACAGPAVAESRFELGFRGPEFVFGNAGDVVTTEFFCTLYGRDTIGSETVAARARGWALGVEAMAGTITSITIEGTDAEAALTDGFERSEVTTGPGNQGAISKVIYSLPPNLPLNTLGLPNIARISVGFAIPEGRGTAMLRYRDGLRGTQDVVENFVQDAGGARRVPRLHRREVIVIEDRPSFRLGFYGSPLVIGQVGSVVRMYVSCNLGGNYPSGRIPEVEGWAIGVAADGARITDIRLGSGQVSEVLENGFVHNEITAGPGNEGAISVVRYSSSPPTSLALSGGPRCIANLTLEAEVPPGGRVVRLRYVDGLMGAAGSIRNHVVEDARQFEPSLGEMRIFVGDADPCGEVMVGFSAANVDSRAPFDGVFGGVATSGELMVSAPRGQQGRARAYPDIVSILSGQQHESCSGIDGWSISVEVTGDADPVGVSFQASAAYSGYARYFSGFEKSEIVDPVQNGGRRGAVSAVLISFQCFSWLPAQSTVSVLEIEVQSTRAQTAEPVFGELRFADGLQGSGQPVRNTMAWMGRTLLPCNLGAASLALRFVESSRFIRGDSNGDARVDLSDAIGTLEEIFSGGPATACKDAADANDSGEFDISDPIYLLRHLFLGGPAPPAPFPACGEDPGDEGDGLACLESQVSCD